MTTMTAPARGPVTTPGHVPPDRSLAQRRDALERANRVRTVRAELKQDLKARRTTFREALDRSATDPDLSTMKVSALILATPNYGRVKANRTLVRLRISPSKTLGGLSDRQRGELRIWIR